MEGAYTLPPDAKLGPKDLCRLFCSPQMIVPPTNMKAIMNPSSSASCGSKIEAMVTGHHDIMWGDVHADLIAKLQNTSSKSTGFKNEDDNDCGSDYNDGDDNFVYNDEDYDDDDALKSVSDNNKEVGAVDTNVVGGIQDGLQIRVDGMLQASRKVEKINIGYSTISKRVNVKNLKSEIWDWVDGECPNEGKCGDNEGENMKPDNKVAASEGPAKRKFLQEKSSTASFQDMISNIAKNNQREVGQEVSVSYYFICLLHLANEKGLKIEDQNNFADLQISKDMFTL